ncbi:MAG: Cyclase/dehydrase [Frankiales bacterium]|nr:Cyclase/dehydrase [Frankiales bacterium]
MTTKVEKSIQVDAPLSTVYDQWTQFEQFPRFMGGITEVRQTTDTTMHWTAEIAGVRREWDARILEQVPDEKIAWAATTGATNAGAVYFAGVGAGQTLVRLVLEYQPEGLVEKAGDALGIVEKQAEGDLERFKAFIEARGSETGGWRGEVTGTHVGTPHVDDAAASRGDSGKAGTTTAAKVAGVAAAAVGVAAAAALKGGKQEQTPEATTLPVVDVVEVQPVVVETPLPGTVTTPGTEPYPLDEPVASPLPTDTQSR